MALEWKTLPEWISIKIPSKDRDGRPIAKKVRERWLATFRNFLLNPEGMRGTGYETVAKRGTWRKGPKGIFDPQTGELVCIEERVEEIKMYCSKRQLRLFVRRGRGLMVQMGRELKQDAVAYADTRGLHIRTLYSDAKVKNEKENSSETRASNQRKTQTNRAQLRRQKLDTNAGWQVRVRPQSGD